MESMAALQDGFDEQKPSLFELLSEQQLNGLLPPTLRYLLTLATQRHPRYLLRVLNSFDELYALAMLVVERHYLHTRGGSFTEHFYGLKRERGATTDLPRASTGAPAAVADALKLSAGAGAGGGLVWKNLAVMVAVPYLRRKLDEAYEVNAPRALLGAAYNRLPPRPTLRDRLAHLYRRFLTDAYPGLHAAYTLAVLAFHLAYLFDGSRYHHPLLWLVGTRIRRMNAADHRAAETLLLQKTPALSASLSPRHLGPRLLSSLSVLLPASIFALKFLEWWHASDFARQLSRKAAEGLDLPPPIVTGLSEDEEGAGGGHIKGILKKDQPSPLPSPQKPAARDDDDDGSDDKGEPAADNAAVAPIAIPSLLPILTVPAPASSDLCPICEDAITTATACQTGVVYCYTCIHRWVAGQHPRQEHFMADRTGRWESGAGRCAVTGRRVPRRDRGLAEDHDIIVSLGAKKGAGETCCHGDRCFIERGPAAYLAYTIPPYV